MSTARLNTFDRYALWSWHHYRAAGLPTVILAFVLGLASTNFAFELPAGVFFSLVLGIYAVPMLHGRSVDKRVKHHCEGKSEHG